METKGFILNGKEYQFSEILEKDFNLSPISDFETTTLSNIRNWLSNQGRFSFKTSGSTGTPKEISFSREQVVKSAQRSIEVFNLLPGQIALCCLNPQFVAGFMMLVRAIEGKMNLIVTEPDSNPMASIGEQIIDFVAMTPNQVQSCLDTCPDKFRQVRTVLIGGAGLHDQLESQLQSLDSEIYHSYAMTETLTHEAVRNISKGEKRFHALAGVTFVQDEDGCLIINDQVLGISKLHTNDIIKLENERTFEWIGRIDHMINSGGIKIQIEELETKIRPILNDMGLNEPFCVVAKPDLKLTNKIVLLIEGQDREYDELQVISRLKSQLPRYHEPKDIIFVPSLFETKTGKIDRIKNSDVYL